jgi:rfaE bifunctional protein nucleotidyltransferase chain/domain
MHEILSVADLRRLCTHSSTALAEKIVSVDAPIATGLGLTRPLVFTNGVFDILHRGHVTYLAAARAIGAALVVAVNTDASARLLGKGEGRPHNGEKDRALVLAGLASVDKVLFFALRTPCELLSEVRPDIYVKGGDYDMETLEETRLVRSWGGEAYAIPFVEGYSTTRLLDRARRT